MLYNDSDILDDAVQIERNADGQCNDADDHRDSQLD